MPSSFEVTIRPRTGWQPVDFKEIFLYRELLAFLVWRDIKIRYRQTLLGGLWAVRFVWGRSYAGTRARLAGTPRRVFWAVFTPLLPGLLVARMTLMAWKKRRTMGAFLKALPLTALLEVGWSCGEFIGYATARANAAGAQTAEALARGSGVGL